MPERKFVKGIYRQGEEMKFHREFIDWLSSNLDEKGFCTLIMEKRPESQIRNGNTHWFNKIEQEVNGNF